MRIRIRENYLRSDPEKKVPGSATLSKTKYFNITDGQKQAGDKVLPAGEQADDGLGGVEQEEDGGGRDVRKHLLLVGQVNLYKEIIEILEAEM